MPHGSASDGYVLGTDLRDLAEELAGLYLAGELVIIAGAGVSRASGMPGWAEMVAFIQDASSTDLPVNMDASDLEAVLKALHQSDPISRADSLRRLTTARVFYQRTHAALYAGASPDIYRPSAVHWHIASFADHRLMPDIFTSNYDDLLEDAKQALPRAGRIRHFHGRLPQAWAGTTNLFDPPVVTSRDYAAAAESTLRYTGIMEALKNKTALLVGFSLSDPNLIRIIHSHARDCRAVVVASRGELTPAQQRLRLDLLRQYWQGLKIGVSAIEAHEELPAFLLALRRGVLRRRGQSPAALADRALRATVLDSPLTWAGAQKWRHALKQAVGAAKHAAPTLRRDTTLRAGFYAMEADGYLTHLVSSDSTKESYNSWPRRRLKADDPRPWGAAGYCWAAGVTIASSATGGAFDRNVPNQDLIEWQQQRAAQDRLPASSVLCVPAFVRYDRALAEVGVLYFSSRIGEAFDAPAETKLLRRILEIALADMIDAVRSIEGGLP